MPFVDKVVKPDQLDEVMPLADVVFISAPDTPKSHKMMGARQFELMKKNSYFIAVSRGGIYDMPAGEGARRETAGGRRRGRHRSRAAAQGTCAVEIRNASSRRISPDGRIRMPRAWSEPSRKISGALSTANR